MTTAKPSTAPGWIVRVGDGFVVSFRYRAQHEKGAFVPGPGEKLVSADIIAVLGAGPAFEWHHESRGSAEHVARALGGQAVRSSAKATKGAT